MELQTSLYTSTHAERVRKKSASRNFGATLIKPRNDVVKNSYYHFIRLTLEKCMISILVKVKLLV